MAKANMQSKRDKRPATTAPRQATSAAAGNKNATRKIAGVKGAAPSNPTIRESVTVTQLRMKTARLLMKNLTFEMRGGRKQAKPDCGRPLDGRVRAHGGASPEPPANASDILLPLLAMGAGKPRLFTEDNPQMERGYDHERIDEQPT